MVSYCRDRVLPPPSYYCPTKVCESGLYSDAVPFEGLLLKYIRAAKLQREGVWSFGVRSEASCKEAFREEVKEKPIFVG